MPLRMFECGDCRGIYHAYSDPNGLRVPGRPEGRDRACPRCGASVTQALLLH